MNQYLLVGKVTSFDQEKGIVNILNKGDKEYLFSIELRGQLLENLTPVIKQGCLIGVKGRMENIEGNVVLVGERVSVLEKD